MLKKMSMVISIILMLALLLSGCGNQENTADVETGTQTPKNKQVYSGKEGRITVYMSGPATMLAAIEEKFEEDRGDVMDVVALGCGPLAQKVWTENEAGNIQADVIWGAEPILYEALKGKNILMQYKSPAAEQLCPEYKIGDGYYTLVNARYGVIIYNTEKVTAAEAPKSWADLKAPRWKGKLVMADATQSAMALALAAGLNQLHDNKWDYLKALKENDIRLSKQNNAAIEMVQTGEAFATIAPHDGALRAINKAKKDGVKNTLAVAWPAEGAISVQRPIAIIKNDARPDANQKLSEDFIDFMLSPAIQKLTAKFAFISVMQNQELPAGIPESVKAFPIDWDYACAHEDELRDGFENIMAEK